MFESIKVFIFNCIYVFVYYIMIKRNEEMQASFLDHVRCFRLGFRNEENLVRQQYC